MSTHSSKILAGIRAAFLGFRWLFILGLAGIAIQFFVVPDSITATVSLESPDATSVDRSGPAEPVVRVHALKADMELPVGPSADPELKTLARTATLPGMFAAAVAGLVLCEIVQRLVRNLKTGELFSARNWRLLRGFAVILVGSTVLVRVLAAWGNAMFARYAAAHLTVAGAHVVGTADHVSLASLQLNLGNADLVVLLLLLLVIWAFREGAELKRESELTI